MLFIIEPHRGSPELIERITVCYRLLRGIAKEDGGCDCICHVIERIVAIVVVHDLVGVVLARYTEKRLGLLRETEGFEGETIEKEKVLKAETSM